MDSELDSQLSELFRSKDETLPAEPFVARTAGAIERRRRRSALFTNARYAAGVVLIALLSPWLIDASVLLTAGLERVFAPVDGFLSTPAGMVAVVAVCALAAASRTTRGFVRSLVSGPR